MEASVSTAWKRQPQEKRMSAQSGTTTGRLGVRKKGAEHFPSALTADQVLTAKKVEIGNFQERGVYDVLEKGNCTDNRSGSVAFNLKVLEPCFPCVLGIGDIYLDLDTVHLPY